MDRIGKSEFIKLVRQEYENLNATLEQYTPELMVLPGLNPQGWSVKDILAHLEFWQKHTLNELQEALAGNPRPHFEMKPGEVWEQTLDRINHEYYRKTQHLTLEYVWTSFRQTYQEILELLEGLPEAEFEEGSALEQSLEGEPVSSAVGSNTFDHYAEHNQTIREWLDKLRNN
jgi:hypothetical protein